MNVCAALVASAPYAKPTKGLFIDPTPAAGLFTRLTPYRAIHAAIRRRRSQTQ